MGYLKRNATAIAIGALVIVGGSYVGAKALTAPQTVSLDSASSSDPAPATSAQPRGPIRGEAVIARRNGTFPTVRFNKGILSSLDGTTLVISEADGTTQRVDTTSDTHFRRDGKKATLSDLQPGDHVATAAIKDGDTFTTRFVRAFSPDAWNARQAQRQQFRAQRRGQ
jgi:hypothetical protein